MKLEISFGMALGEEDGRQSMGRILAERPHVYTAFCFNKERSPERSKQPRARLSSFRPGVRTNRIQNGNVKSKTLYPNILPPPLLSLYHLSFSLFISFLFLSLYGSLEKSGFFFPFSEIEFVIGRERRGERRPKELANVSKWTLNLNYISHALERERCRAPTRENS